jgi:hypothetical protein
MQCTNSMVSLFDSIYNENSCQAMAYRCQFIQRSSSKIKGHEFIKVLTLPSEGISEASLNDLCIRLKKFNMDADISASALAQRVNTHTAVALMKEAFQKILRFLREHVVKQFTSVEGVLSNFSNIYIHDSTVIELNQKLQKIYKGTRRGGLGGCKSQVKVDLIHNFTTGIIHDAKIVSGNIPDQELSRRIVDFTDVGDLVIRDLGYFALDAFRQIAEKHAYYLSRLPPHLKVYLKVDDTKHIDLAKHLDKHFSNCSVINIEVFVGEERLSARLIAYRAPEDVVRERLRKAHKRARDSKRVLSDAKRNLMRFSLFITNAPEDLLPAEVVGTIYRLRWEIELIFKQWKGLLKIDVLRGISHYRIECLLWGRLCMVMIVAMVCGVFMNLSKRLCCTELSPIKLIVYLMRENKLSQAVSGHRVEELLQEITEVMPRRFLKDKRDRKTMRERAIQLEHYYECGACA